MSIRPFRDINRKKTKVINVGKLKIGGMNNSDQRMNVTTNEYWKGTLLFEIFGLDILT